MFIINGQSFGLTEILNIIYATEHNHYNYQRWFNACKIWFTAVNRSDEVITNVIDDEIPVS